MLIHMYSIYNRYILYTPIHPRGKKSDRNNVNTGGYNICHVGYLYIYVYVYVYVVYLLLVYVDVDVVC